MKHILIANVGNSDVYSSALPKELRSAREKGDYLLSNYKDCKKDIEISLILPTLKWIKAETGCKNPDIEIVLIASDQNPTYTPAEDYSKDTKPYAEVIQRYLMEMDDKAEKERLQKKQIRIEPIESNPADYANALEFQHQTLDTLKSRLDRNYGEDGYRVYLEVSGGTPAMCSMLIVTGAEVFGKNVTTLYLDRSSDIPNQIDISRALYSRQARSSFKQQLSIYAYGVATKTLQDQEEFILTDSKKSKVMSALVQYADRRLSFDFDMARQHLSKAQTSITGIPQSKIRYWLGELQNMTTRDYLAELLHTMQIKIEAEDYTDLTQRMFRFQESIFRYLAERMGIEYSKSDDTQYLSQTWLATQPSLTDYLGRYSRDHKGKKTGKSTLVETTRALNRFSLGGIVDYHVESVDQWKPLKQTTEAIHLLSEVAELRNKGISGHGWDGVSRTLIEESYPASIEDLIQDLKQIYCGVFEVEQIPPSPYQAVNELLLELLEESA